MVAMSIGERAEKMVTTIGQCNSGATVRALIDDATWAEIANWSGCDIDDAPAVARAAERIAKDL